MYAAMDTHYLLSLRDLLEAELRTRDLWQLALEDFGMACQASAQKPPTESPSWSRFSSRRDLSPRELTVLKELLACRDEIASRLDRPAFKVLGDDRLLELAKAQPATWEDLEALGLSVRELDLVGRDVLRAVAEGLESPLVERRRPVRPAAIYLKRLEKLKEWRKKVAAEMDVESDVVLPRGLLLALAENGGHNIESTMQAFPWRLHRFGGQITGMLEAIGAS
jgi:ribonuclease D